MASIGSLVLSVAVASTPLDSPHMQKVERRAAILSGVGVAFALGGSLAAVVGSMHDETPMTLGGGALIAIGVHAIMLAVVAWLWPDDSWLGLVTDELTIRPPARAL